MEKLAELRGIMLKAVDTAIQVAFESMTDTLEQRNQVEIRGLGTFHVKH